MFTAFNACITRFFAMFTSLFITGENLAQTTVILSEVAKSTAELYADEARVKRAKQLATLNAELKVAEQQAANAIANAMSAVTTTS